MLVHISLLIILLVLNTLPIKMRKRKTIILPLSFLVLLYYWAFRYEYGQDYWAYYDYFYSERESKHGFGEVLFTQVFFPMFKYYYQAVIAQSIFVLGSIYFIVRKYVSPECYWIFFFLFMTVTSLHFSLISAMRTSMAAATLFWGFELFYIKKSNYLLLIVLVFIATLFHTSAIVFAIIPILDKILSLLKSELFFYSLVILLLLALVLGNSIFLGITGSISFLNEYEWYSEEFVNSNIIGTIVKSIILIPAYYICKCHSVSTNKKFNKICVLAFLCIAIRFLNLDFHGRFTAYLYIFFICALCYTYLHINPKKRFFLLGPYFAVVIFELYRYYTSIIINASRFTEGNIIIYKTIFDASSLP